MGLTIITKILEALIATVPLAHGAFILVPMIARHIFLL